LRNPTVNGGDPRCPRQVLQSNGISAKEVRDTVIAALEEGAHARRSPGSLGVGAEWIRIPGVAGRNQTEFNQRAGSLMSGKTLSAGPLKVFTYLTAEKVAEYRAIMRVFTEAKARFALHLRPQEIVAVLAKGGPEATIDLASVEISLRPLCDWGNIEARADR